MTYTRSISRALEGNIGKVKCHHTIRRFANSDALCLNLVLYFSIGTANR